MARRVHAEGLRERRNMSQTIPEPTHDIVAVDAEGNVMYETACAWGEDEAEREVESHNRDHEPGDDYDSGPVERFEARER